MTAPRWPAPGTTYGPDRLHEVRDLLRAWPGRGVWIRYSELGGAEGHGWFYDNVANGDCWHYVGPHPSDPPDTQPAEPARTVVRPSWQYLRRRRTDAPWVLCASHDREYVTDSRADHVAALWECGPVVEVRAALPLPVEPAVVVGTVVQVEVPR